MIVGKRGGSARAATVAVTICALAAMAIGAGVYYVKSDKDVKRPVDVQTVTLSASILTDRQIELTPSYRGGPELEDGETIGLGHTKTPVEFGRVRGMLDRLSVSLKGDSNGQGPVADIINSDNGSVRVRGLTDHLIFDNQLTKEICNLVGLRQLGCSTGTLQDYCPDFGLTHTLDGLASLGQK